jgi:lysophospholipid acyltransferase (LPLAT)-like uncharacterized protein
MASPERSFREWRRRRAYDILPIFPPVVRAIIRLIGATLNVTTSGEDTVRELLASKRPFLLAFFHGRQFLLTYHLQGMPLTIMTSISYLGDIQTRTLQGLGFTIVRGSSSRGGAKVLAQTMRNLKKGFPAALAVDGPRGPHQIVKPGIIFLSKKLDVPIIPVSTSARPSRVFMSAWDKYILPFPFARAHIRFGKPFIPEIDKSDESVEAECGRLANMLLQLDIDTDREVGRV